MGTASPSFMQEETLMTNLRTLSRDQKKQCFAYTLIAPVMIYLLVFMLFPLCWAVWTSLTNKAVGSGGGFVGLKNFSALFADRVFHTALLNTLYYTVAAVAGKFVVGILMALTLNARIPGKNLSRVLMLVPWTIPTLVSALTWKWMYSDTGGLFNYLLMSLGVTDRVTPWLYSATLAMPSIIVANIWRGAPFIGISVLAGLQTIEGDLYEAAHIDGAGPVRTFFSITLPLVKEVLILSTLITTIWTFNDFEIVWLLTGGGPANATQILSTYGYTVGFMNLNISKATASAFVAVPVMMLVITLVFRYMRAKED